MISNLKLFVLIFLVRYCHSSLNEKNLVNHSDSTSGDYYLGAFMLLKDNPKIGFLTESRLPQAEEGNLLTKDFKKFLINKKLDFTTTPDSQKKNTTLVLTYDNTDNGCISIVESFGQIQKLSGPTVIFTNFLGSLSIECNSSTELDVRAAYVTSEYTSDLIKNYDGKINSNTENDGFEYSINFELVGQYLFQEVSSANVKYWLLYDISSDNSGKSISLSDYVNSNYQKKELMLFNDKKFSFKGKMTSDVTYAKYTIVAEDTTSGALYKYLTGSAKIGPNSSSDKSESSDSSTTSNSSGLAWYFILLIVIGALIFVIAAVYLVRRFFLR